jgi:hypothetical protein
MFHGRPCTTCTTCTTDLSARHIVGAVDPQTSVLRAVLQELLKGIEAAVPTGSYVGHP